MLRKLLLVGLGLSAHVGAFALGLGEIKLDSALNEPLVAEIPISVTSRGELRGFEARVALNETFARYGLDRPIFLNSLNFHIRNDASGQPVLHVTSTRPIAEPFVTFLLEATWDSGRLLREYTVLLDPPVFNQQAIAAPVNVAQSVTAQRSTTSGQIAPNPAPAPAPGPEPRQVYRQPAISGQTYGPVQRNQNLWNISKSVQLNDVTINQMMIAIYRANPEAFMGNINLLKEGATLQIPDSESVRNLLRSDANSVVVAHNSDWRGGRVASSGNRVASTSGSVTRNTRLKLVAPDSSTAGAGSSDGSADLNAARDLLATELAENAELTSELDTVRAELEETRRLLNLKNADLAELQQSLAKDAATDASVEMAVPELVDEGVSDPVETEVTADVDTATETGVDTETAVTDPASLLETNKPAEKPVVVDTSADEGGSFFGFLKNGFLWAGLALLGILGTLFVMFRNRGEESVEPWDAIPVEEEDDVNMDLDASLDKVAQQTMAKDTANIGAREVEYFEDTGTFKPIDFNASETGQVPALGSVDDSAPFEDTLAGETGVKLDQSDAVSEADFHMAYGLYDQAAELVGKASEQEPERLDYKMKLLEIYFVWGNKDQFRSGAADAQEMISAHPGEWEKIMIMGKQICPDDDLFAGDASGDLMGDSVDLQLETANTDLGSLDFQAEDFGGADVFGGQDEGGNDVVDLDLGGALFASDDAPTATGADSNVLDFSFDEDVSIDDFDDAPTANTEDVKEKIELALASSLSGEDTEEMDLEKLGIDLDFGDVTSVSEGTSGEFAVHDVNAGLDDADEDFDQLFDGLGDEDDAPSAMIDADMISESITHDKLLDTSELKVEMEELLKDDSSGLMDRDQTARGVASLIPDEDLLDIATDNASDETGSFSAEIRSLASEELEIGEELAAASGPVDFGFDDDEDTVLQETLVAPDEFKDLMNDDEVDAVLSDSDEETVLASTLVANDSNKVDLAEPFGDPSQDTTAMPVFDPEEVNGEVEPTESVTFHGIFDEPESTQAMPKVDDFSQEVFPSPDGRTQEVQAIDLDVGETVDDSGDNTTMRVATSNLALPENADLAINEVGTKLDLARAYLDMGDPDGARGILDEVIQEGNDNQQADARALLDGLA